MTNYNLESLDMPVLTGWRLKLFAAALKNPITRLFMIQVLIRPSGLLKFRKFAIEEPPTHDAIVYLDKDIRTCDPEPCNFSIHEPAPAEGTQVFPYPSIRNYYTAYHAHRITPVTVAEKVLNAIVASDKRDEPLRAFIACNHEDVMDQARAATKRIQAGEYLSVFDGVPVAIKDEIDQRPYPTTVGTSFLGNSPATEDATVVNRLRAAGCLLIGKTNMHEIGINPNGLNCHHGTVRNPYHTAHDSGGSSSGSAAAVAAGICPVAIGADGGGSIRIPAALCNLVGLKPTLGRISEHGAFPLCWSVAHLGPIGTCVEDVALTYAVIAGPDSKDPRSERQPAVRLGNWKTAELKGMTLGIYADWFNHAAPSIVSACEAMLNNLNECGAGIKEIEIPELDETRIAHAVTILCEMSANMDKYRHHRDRFGPPAWISLEFARAITANDYIHAQQMRTRAIKTFQEVFEKVDAVITPTTAITAPAIPSDYLSAGWSDLGTVTELMRFIFPPNLTGLPAISFPVGFDETGLPIGMQAIGRPWDEHALLQIAYAAEQYVECKRPQVFFEILN
jgi:Asp-tRNA(Asn)/Glu-tRNA(Gln) amidotransferase A subunit family amidase